jgi:hypothetical protein
MDNSERDIGSGTAVLVPRAVLAFVAGFVVLVLAFTITIAVLQLTRADRLAHTESDRRAAAGTASSFGRDLYTYSYDNLGAARSNLLALATARFAKNYDAQYAQGLQATLQRLKVDASATAEQVYMTTGSGTQATAVVELATDLRTPGTSHRGLSYLQLGLIKQDGKWKVDTVQTIGSPPTT